MTSAPYTSSKARRSGLALPGRQIVICTPAAAPSMA